MFHAESGLKKGPPISDGETISAWCRRYAHHLRAVKSIKVSEGTGTAQTQPGGRVINKSTAFICSSELTSSIVEDKVATDILTDLYDRQYNIGEWRSSTEDGAVQSERPHYHHVDRYERGALE